MSQFKNGNLDLNSLVECLKGAVVRAEIARNRMDLSELGSIAEAGHKEISEYVEALAQAMCQAVGDVAVRLDQFNELIGRESRVDSCTHHDALPSVSVHLIHVRSNARRVSRKIRAHGKIVRSTIRPRRGA